MREQRTALRVRVFAVAAGVLAAGTLAPGGGAGASGSPAKRASALRQRDTVLGRQSRSARLELYALDSRLRRQRLELASLHTQATDVARQQADALARLALARRSLTVAERRLGGRLRALYERGSVTPLEAVLEAASLDEALTKLDALGRLAAQDRSVVAQTRTARRVLLRLSAALAARRERVGRLQSGASAAVDALGTARAERTAFLARLATSRRLNAAQLAAFQARARATDARAQTISSRAPDPSPPAGAIVPPPPGRPEATFAVSPAGKTLTVTATGYALSGGTATGAPTGWGVVAVDPGVIPLGTRLTIPGYGEGVAADTGPAVQGRTIDIWFPTPAQALAWGRRMVTITLH